MLPVSSAWEQETFARLQKKLFNALSAFPDEFWINTTFHFSKEMKGEYNVAAFCWKNQFWKETAQ